MKHRLLTVFAAAALLTGCGGDSIPDEPVAHIGEETTTAAAETTTTAAETTTAPQTTDTAAAATTSAAETASPAETTAAAVSTAASGTEGHGSQHLLTELFRRVREGSGYVTVKLDTKMEEQTYHVYEVFGKGKYYVESELISGTGITYCSDGTHTYIIDKETRSYAETLSPEMDPSGLYDDLPDQDIGDFLGSGTDLFQGKNYLFEDYSQTEDGGLSSARFFFDAEGNLVGATVLSGEQAGTSFEYVIRVDKSVDPTLFSPPAAYKQVSETELMQTLTKRWWSGMGDLDQMPQITTP